MIDFKFERRAEEYGIERPPFTILRGRNGRGRGSRPLPRG